MRLHRPRRHIAIRKTRRTRRLSIWRHLKGYVQSASTRRRKLTYALSILAAHLRSSGWQDMAGYNGIRGGQEDRSGSPKKRVIWAKELSSCTPGAVPIRNITNVSHDTANTVNQ